VSVEEKLAIFLLIVEHNKKTRGYVPWNNEMDKVLLDTFVDYYNKGDR
jgi:hypothetical protein